MKKLLSLSFALLLACATAFAQGSGSSGGGKNENLTGLAKITQVMTVGLCDCFNQYGIGKMSSEGRKAIEKLRKNKVETVEEMEKVLTKAEMEAIAQEASRFDENNPELEKCSEEVQAKITGLEDDFMKAMAEVDGNEEKFEENLQNKMTEVMKNSATCNMMYYIYLMDLKISGK